LVDRVIVYPGQIPLDSDVLSTNRNAMIALGYLARATIGPGPAVDGLACLPTLPASMQVTVGQGAIIATSTIDASAYGTLPSDLDPLVKMGINPFGATTFTLTAPGVSGQTIAYLIEAQLVETDSLPISLPYYNAANPQQPFTGPNNNQAQQNTVRTQRVGLQLKAGSAAAAGTQLTPAVDAGWVGLYVITVNFAQTTIATNSITVYPGAPFIGAKIPNLAPLTSPVFLGSPLSVTPPLNDNSTRIATTAFVSAFGHIPSASATFVASSTWTVPAGVTRVVATVVGAGGGGSNSLPTVAVPGTALSSGGGGGAGGLAKGIYTVVPGAVITITIGAQGTSQASGGTSSFGTFCSASGGAGSSFQSSDTSAGGGGGIGVGGTILNFRGGVGSDGQSGTYNSTGNGAPGPFGGGGRAYAGGNSRLDAQAPGSGGGGSYASSAGSNVGGFGGTGLVVLEW
jgi:hypothetical protein